MNAPDKHLYDANALACLCVGIAPKLSASKPAPMRVESFNDDDVYIYKVDTKEIVRTIPASSPLTIGIGGQGLRVRAGETWDKGMTCKWKGLWTRRQDAAERIVR